MTIYPAIDIKSGRCVRLTQDAPIGDDLRRESGRCGETIQADGSAWVHVVDLDGHSGEPQNLAAVQAIAALG